MNSPKSHIYPKLSNSSRSPEEPKNEDKSPSSISRKKIGRKQRYELFQC